MEFFYILVLWKLRHQKGSEQMLAIEHRKSYIKFMDKELANNEKKWKEVL